MVHILIKIERIDKGCNLAGLSILVCGCSQVLRPMGSPLALWGEIEAAKKPTSPCHRHGFSPQVFIGTKVNYS